jgi:NodT family efflux transporter outer membrane factor (OMF) lipoprotein
MKGTQTFSAILTLMAAGFGGCTVGPNYHEPKIPMPAHFGELSGTNANAERSRAKESSPEAAWWRTFNDPELDKLIAAALRENLNLRIAAERIREARYQRSIIAADLFPNIDADGAFLHARGSKNVLLPLGGSGAGGDPPVAPPPGSVGPSPFSNELTPFGKGGLPGVTSSLYQIGFDSTWELDVFGGNRRRLESGAANLTAAVESLRGVGVSLMAEVAVNYLQLRGTQERLSIALKNLASQQETLELATSRAKAGLTSQADVTRAAAQVAITAASIAPLETSARQYIHAISTLLSREPTALQAELSLGTPLPVAPPKIPVGLPSELLKRRPDIRRAERLIAAANAQVGTAKADLFPKFGLTGSIGLDSTSTQNLFNLQSHYFLVSPTATWRVFDAGRILSNVALQKATEREAEMQYRSTILTAFREVEDALVAYSQEQAHHESLTKAMEQTEDSLRLVRSQYQNGLANFLDVLDAERSVLSIQDQVAISKQSITTDVVALYKALGGGWEMEK